ncbi:cytochrome P450 [Actinosynnema sp. NPDC047251]|uniref:Cytochrome P450 family protein n=1 Tax=Saccharothrix espanaensis (strain ATCC 51144 / DSM 44229 / JCM 9112 / NBRC 15066 / NRRL 15764) TaxID=1179773 RepID=K0K0S5_SACES|nr:cytochrome P450 [Saccharothrix espanaensis]CCH31122.1 Cytochrome P450 family protein [Saccharothrix espanaensis DSM 44229]
MNWERRVQLAAHPVLYPLVRGAGRIGPVVRIPGVGVLVSDAALAKEVLTDPHRFTKTGPGSSADLWTPVVGPTVLLNMEGDVHTTLRRKLSGLFTTRSVAELCARVAEEPMKRLRDDLAAGRPVDLVTVVRHLVGAVICELVGLDPTEAVRAHAAGAAITSMVRLGRPTLTPEQVRRSRAALARLTRPAATAYAAGDPATVPGRMRELGLTEQEALGAVAAFVLTGTETLVSYVPRLVALLHDAGWLDRVAADRSRVDDVVAEALRVTVPSPVMLRSVTTGTSVGKVRVRAGDRVVIATISAAKGRHPFDPDRPHSPAVRQVWFGAGAHFCLGMPLANAEIRAVLNAVLDSAPLSIVDRKAARRVLLPGYERLVLRRA